MSVCRRVFKINGAQRAVICDPNDNLAAVLRRLGLTGVKIACGTGQCGACSVIIDDKVVRSCTKKVKSIPEFAEITTIEGIGTPNNLHPLQRAWIYHGGVQCGFCTPGFIVSAYQLLKENPDPTRQEVRDWFQKHRNLCRCTGYKPLVDAVMAAAAVMRGDAPLDSIIWKAPEDGDYYGKAMPRRESGIARVTGLANYGDDFAMQMPRNTLHLAVVSPFCGHAKIKGIDFSEAEKMPGVAGFVTAADVKGTNRFCVQNPNPRSQQDGSERPFICEDKIYGYGDVVALVAAHSREEARAAAAKVKVDLEKLPEYTSQLEAALPDSVQIHEGKDNVFFQWPLIKGEDTRDVIDDNEDLEVVEGSFFSGKQPHLPLEPDTGQAYVDDDGNLVIHWKAQYIYGVPGVLAGGIGVPMEKIRVQMNECGGAFGSAITPHIPGMAAIAALKFGVPCSLTLSYAENQLITGKRHGINANMRVAADKSGKIQAFEYEACYDSGRYSETPQILLGKTHTVMGSPYYIPNIRGVAKVCASNVGYGTAYRSYAGVQPATCQEGLMDMMAEKLGMDPLEFRYQNVAVPGDTCASGTPYVIYPGKGMIDMLRPKYQAALERAKAESTDTKKRGVGVAMGVYTMGAAPDMAEVKLELTPKNKIRCYSTWEDMGQHAEASQLLHVLQAFKPMGLTEDQVELVMGDNFTSPDTGVAGGSRCHYYGGNATIDGANKLMALMKKDDGTWRTYEEMQAEGLDTVVVGHFDSPDDEGDVVAGDLDYNTGYGRYVHELMYNLTMAEVEVDTETGKTKVVKFTSLVDIGPVGNKQGVEGQAYSGIEHGIGYALKEKYYDMSKHDNMIGCGFLEINEMPDDIDLMFHVTERKYGPYGSSGCSENFQQTPHMSVINAINNAIGVRIYELPATPDKVLAGLKAKAEGKDLKPEKYYLGRDLFEELEYCEENPV